MRMWGLTQGELADDNFYNPVDALFSDHPPIGRSELNRSEFLERITAGREDARHLRWLPDPLGDAFRLGVVLHSGQFPARLGDRLWALPFSTLWQVPR
ncbi:MAG: hypothetical protein OXH86_12795 [Acidimicrobiaceae bacterium]|nr:hypothetical protein [Acidimicrobiaceae bacterium]MDE0498221.1 hypothetical protein [Acidimicrobiaceae bacterium]